MIYVTGDTHGKQKRWVEKIEPVLKAGDILLVLGDFGYGWDGCYWPKEMFYDHISEQPYVVAFLDGNHDNNRELNSRKVEEWNGGRVHKIRDNLIHLMRGEIYTIEGNSIFVFGGGYSCDKDTRKENESWWPEEMPSNEEYDNADDKLEKAGYKVDYILTHTAPINTIEYLAKDPKHGIEKNFEEETPLTNYLQYVTENVEFKRLYFGHLHVDVELMGNQIGMLNAIRELESGKIVKQWTT